MLSTRLKHNFALINFSHQILPHFSEDLDTDYIRTYRQERSCIERAIILLPYIKIVSLLRKKQTH